MVPALLNAKPAGNAPDTTVQEYGAVPPAAAKVAEYADPTVALGSKAVVMVGAAPAAIVLIESSLVAFWAGEDESTTCTVKAGWPTVVGIPLIVPPWLKLNPAGKDPDATVQEYGLVPPLADIEEEYVVPTVAAGNADVPMARDVAATCGVEPEENPLQPLVTKRMMNMKLRKRTRTRIWPTGGGMLRRSKSRLTLLTIATQHPWQKIPKVQPAQRKGLAPTCW